MAKYWVTEPDAYLEPCLTASGFGARPPKTVMEVFKTTKEKFGNRNAMALKRPVNNVVPSEWTFWTWDSYYNDCMRFAKTLIHLGADKFKIVNILGFNSPEWLIANCGAMFAGCIAAGIYASNTAEACHYISEHSKAEVVCLEDNKQLAKYATLKGRLPYLKALVVWAERPDMETANKCGVPVYYWPDFLDLGKGVSDDDVNTRSGAIKPGNCSTLIYTSGTTGPPKAVMISHDNVTWTIANMLEPGHYVDMNHTDRLCSYLPLSHIAAQLIDIHAPIALGCCVYFCQPDALKGTLAVTLKDVHPTLFFGVPRVWEKMQEKMVQVGRTLSSTKRSISAWAKSIGTERAKMSQYGASGGYPWMFGCAKKLILSKVRDALGLDKCKACFTAAAPIAPETLWYFGSVDIPVYEVFGQSECTGPHTVSSSSQWKIGYCGRPMRGTATKIVKETGELTYKGRHIMMGYMHMPDKTEETIDSEGFLHSGDVADFDGNDFPEVPSPSGFMKITGRIKELIITAGGENIPPVLIENEMKASMNAISNCMVIGDKKKFLTMIITIKTEVDNESEMPTDILANDSLHVGNTIGSNAKTIKDVENDPLWTKYFNDGMKTANSKTTSSAQIVQKWKLLPVDFSVKAGELTPTLKLKRNVVADKYAALIDSMYVGAE